MIAMIKAIISGNPVINKAPLFYFYCFYLIGLILTELFSENQNKKTKTIKIICVLNTKHMFPFLVKTFIFLKIDFNYSNTSKGRSTSIFLPLNFDDLYSAYREFCCSGK